MGGQGKNWRGLDRQNGPGVERGGQSARVDLARVVEASGIAMTRGDPGSRR
jgi:hypothetical protein